ncbi:MAG TPA: hypothetical protein VEH84_10470 [Alphaproteobacteria bacterium]|nr:hypothetical protein [Alphaproteobacteria bacterium]
MSYEIRYSGPAAARGTSTAGSFDDALKAAWRLIRSGAAKGVEIRAAHPPAE